ncbi:MAG: energy transducer TonB [Bacteroidaceae bacterium]|jgi:protein TonB|nr:energy transducer TonB [Bacteroidaceae bacterium]
MKKILSFIFVLIFLAVPSSELSAQKRKQKKTEKNEIVMPSYPGGEKALLKFIMEETRYPSEARVKKEVGEVLVAFSIGMDGYISGVRVLRSVSPSLDAEAVRVVKKMKPWFPGKRNGVPVRAEMTIPINFKIIYEHDKYVADDDEMHRPLDVAF